ncbi:DedA family protein [Saccharopolyspora dendranthemae]|nr:DedA family protein [Saccharopolyspora dendranthemae]
MSMIEWLNTIPSGVIYLVVAGIIGLESVGIPLPGEILLVSSGVAASHGVINPVLLATFAATGAIIGDSIGYAIGKRYGRKLLTWLGTKLPKHFGPKPLAQAEGLFERWGAWTVFGGRFVALLRILAGPLAGSLGMPYRKFLFANATGGIAWAGLVTALSYAFGLVAGQWFHRFSWIGLVIAVAFAWWSTRIIQKRVERAEAEEPEPAQSA